MFLDQLRNQFYSVLEDEGGIDLKTFSGVAQVEDFTKMCSVQGEETVLGDIFQASWSLHHPLAPPPLLIF